LEDDKKKEENTNDKKTESNSKEKKFTGEYTTVDATAGRPPYVPHTGYFDPRELEKEIEEAKKTAIPRAIISSTAPTTVPTSSYQKEWIVKHKREVGGGTILAILALIVGLWPIVSGFIFPPVPEVNVTDLTAVNGNVEGKNPHYLYSATSYVPNGTMNETFSVIVTNTGEAPVKNFWIRFDWEPSGDWLDFSSSGINSQISVQRCPQKSSECTIELITKEMGAVELHYSVVIDHKKYLNTTEPEIILRYSHDNEPEKQIIVDVSMGR